MNPRLVTSEDSFGAVGPEHERLRVFKVVEGIDAEHALEKASCLLEAIVGSIEDAAMGTTCFEGHQGWLTLHAAQSAKAVIDGLWNTLQFAAQGDAL